MKTKANTKTRISRKVGRFSVEFEVANNDDVRDAARGMLPPEKVRRLTISGLVDSGATRLVLPEKVAKKLGLPSTGEVKVTYANQVTAMRDAFSGVHVKLLGREGVFNGSVEPKRRTALIGAIILEDLDLLVDCTHQRLVPRDPRYIMTEIE